MKVVYVAGPFRGPTAWAIEQNIRRAEDVGIKIAEMGAAPLIPHSNSRFFHGTCTEQFWLEATMALLYKSDAVMLCPDWKRSQGTLAELNAATAAGLPVFGPGMWFQLERWIEAGELRTPPPTPVNCRRCGKPISKCHQGAPPDEVG